MVLHVSLAFSVLLKVPTDKMVRETQFQHQILRFVDKYNHPQRIRLPSLLVGLEFNYGVSRSPPSGGKFFYTQEISLAVPDHYLQYSGVIQEERETY